MTRRVIIDTDPGLDDAVAILFALASGLFDVIGVTTLAGNIGLERTTANAGALLTAMGRPLPCCVTISIPVSFTAMMDYAASRCPKP